MRTRAKTAGTIVLAGVLAAAVAGLAGCSKSEEPVPEPEPAAAEETAPPPEPTPEWEMHIAHRDAMPELTDSDLEALWDEAKVYLDANGHDSSVTILDPVDSVDALPLADGSEAMVVKMSVVGTEEFVLAQMEGGAWAVSRFEEPKPESEEQPAQPDQAAQQAEQAAQQAEQQAQQAAEQAEKQAQIAASQQDQHSDLHSTETGFDVQHAWPLSRMDDVKRVIPAEVADRLQGDLGEQLAGLGVTLDNPANVMVSEQDVRTGDGAIAFRSMVMSGNDRIVIDCAYDTATLDHEFSIMP